MKTPGRLCEVEELYVVMDVEWNFWDVVIDFVTCNAAFGSVKSCDLPKSGGKL